MTQVKEYKVLKHMSVYNKNGKWYYNFMQNGDREHGLCHGCNNKKEALEFEVDKRYKLSLVQRGKLPPETKITFKQMMGIYLKYSKANKVSYKSDVVHVKYLIKFFGAETKIIKIKSSDIEAFKLHMRENGKAPATFNRYYNAINKSFNLIVAENPTFLNPCKHVKRLKEDNQKTRYLTPEQEKALFNELPEYLKPLVVCALQTGLRRANVFNLKWKSIDFDMGFLEILKQENKGHKKIQIPISEKLQVTFEEIIFIRFIVPIIFMQNGVNLKCVVNDVYVFINPATNEPFTDIHKGFDGAIKRAGIGKFTFHDLRHTVATRLVMKGVDLKTIQELLAHSQITTTQRYMHATPERKKAAIDILNSIE